MNATSRSGAHRLDGLEELAAELAEERRTRQAVQADLIEQQRLLEMLSQLLMAVRDSGTAEKLLERILLLFAGDFSAHAGELWLRDGAVLQQRATLGVEPRPTSVLSPEEISAEQARASGPWLAQASDGSALRASGTLHCPGVSSLLCVPLVHEGTLIGLITIGLSALPALSEKDEQRLSAVAEHASHAIVERRSIESLRDALHARDEVLGIVAHDLRNPLNVIAAAASSLHHRLPDPLARRPVERIIRASQRAEHLIRDLLDIYAIEGGNFAIEPRQLDTATTLLAAFESQQGLAASSSVILASDLSPQLPSVEADEERLLEVLENLVGNAVKFTAAGGTVTVGAAAREAEVVIWVKDNGPGIAPEQLPHLFDRFWQATRSDRRGAGLGLTICKAIVEAHGGRIWAESEPGQGTTVFFTVPARRRPPRQGRTPIASILIVDDRPENLLSLRAILEQPEYRLVTCSSGEEALSLALRESFAVALIDVAMPGMDGLEVAIHMKELERSRDIPIIFITAFGDDPEEIHRAYSAGGADYLVKPLDAEIVRKKVAVFADLSRRRSESTRSPELESEE